jgi:hypothetical protein
MPPISGLKTKTLRPPPPPPTRAPAPAAKTSAARTSAPAPASPRPASQRATAALDRFDKPAPKPPVSLGVPKPASSRPAALAITDARASRPTGIVPEQSSLNETFRGGSGRVDGTARRLNFSGGGGTQPAVTDAASRQAAIDGPSGRRNLGGDMAVSPGSITSADAAERAAESQAAAGTQRAAEAANLDTVAEDRQAAEDAEAAARTQAEAEAAELQSYANGTAQPPPNTTVQQNGDTVTLTETNEAGEVVEVRTATETDDGTTVSNTQYSADGTATRQSVAVGEDKVVTEQSSWAEARSTQPGRQPTIDELQDNPAATTTQQTFTRDGDELSVRTVQSNAQEVIESTSRFGTQNDFEGINGDLVEQFDSETDYSTPPDQASIPTRQRATPPLDVVETNTTVTPRDGGQPQEVREVSYSQGDVRVTSTDTTNPETGEPNARAWTLQKQVDENTLAQQEFVEGNQQYQRVTTTTATGNNVSVETETQWTQEDQEYRTSESSSTTYAEDGTVANVHSTAVDQEGVRTTSDYSRTTNGNETTETTTTTQTPPDGPEVRTTEAITTRPGADGNAEFVRGSVTTEGPGGSATTTIDPANTQTPYTATVNGQPVTESSQLSEEQAALVAISSDGLVEGINDRFTPPTPGRAGDDANRAAQLGRVIKGVVGLDAAVLAQLNAAHDVTHKAAHARLGSQKAGLFAAGFTVLSAGQNLAQGIRNGDASAIASGAAGAASGLFGAGEAAAKIAQARATIANAPAPGGRLVNFGAKWAGPIGSVFSVVSSAADLFNSGGDKWRIASNVVGIAGGLATAGVGLAAAIGTGAAAGTWAGPVGVAVGAAIGLITVGVQWLIARAGRSDIPDVVI